MTTPLPPRMSGFLDTAIRTGLQQFIQPSTVAADKQDPDGWIPLPRPGTDLVIDLYALAGDQPRTMYWYYESIVTDSLAPVRFTLEGNHAWNPRTRSFPDDQWRMSTGYVVSATSGHQRSGAAIRTRAGEALRLRAHGSLGTSGVFSFKFQGVELPWKE